ncbi:MAG: class I SAM-dependent methyltransferase [Planctomycetes bacterium]|nr:class I SAM-dependent methyltransferase [Planctomycetota bacterium]
MSEATLQDRLQRAYNIKYPGEKLPPAPTLRPDAVSTNRNDDVARLLRGEKGRVLEIGCNTGGLTAALAGQFEHLTGIDISSTAVDAARRRAESDPALRDKLRFEVASADQPLPFPDKSFDVVLGIAVLEHLVFIYEALDEWHRVCKPGGCLILCVPNMAYVKHVVDLLRGRQPLTGSPTRDAKYCREHGWDGHHLHYFTKSSLTDLLRHVGFEPEVWTGDGAYAKYRRWYINFVGSLTLKARRLPDR